MIQKFLAALASLISVSVSTQSPYILTKPMSVKRLSCWAKSFWGYDVIVAYSSLGHFFLRSRKSNEYIALHPFKKSVKHIQKKTSGCSWISSLQCKVSVANNSLKRDRQSVALPDSLGFITAAVRQLAPSAS